METRRVALFLVRIVRLVVGVFSRDSGATIFGFSAVFGALFWYVFGSIIDAENRTTE
ncbi:hypothetical protein [Haladaptatus sp. QDMS2]|uniref:hypothetical protein n=1 Tax=Haladaptatus sp. QDMS2 TaxID=3033391 RepID=UPI0023E8B6F7|nr:hypothetical protein [Haladaptatus sp. QDMS2]